MTENVVELDCFDNTEVISVCTRLLNESVEARRISSDNLTKNVRYIIDTGNELRKKRNDIYSMLTKVHTERLAKLTYYLKVYAEDSMLYKKTYI